MQQRQQAKRHQQHRRSMATSPDQSFSNASSGMTNSSGLLSGRPPLASRGVGPRVQGVDRVPNAPGSVAEAKRQLEQLRRETLEIRALEGQLKAEIHRDTKKLLQNHQSRQDADILRWRQGLARSLVDAKKDVSNARNDEELAWSKDYQMQKRTMKENVRKEDLQRQHDEYLEQRDYSEWMSDVKRLQMQERQTWGVVENLETLKSFAEAKLAADMQEVAHQHERREQELHANAEHQVRLALKERDDALRSLEHIRISG